MQKWTGGHTGATLLMTLTLSLGAVAATRTKLAIRVASRDGLRHTIALLRASMMSTTSAPTTTC
jgi:hypothetical protein